MSVHNANGLAAPAVSIIICTYTRAPLLRKTLMSLERVFDIEQSEVIVVDNHSIDDTAEVVLSCIEALKNKVARIRYVFEPRQGLSIARNTGIELAAAPILAFLDDDAIPHMNWLNSLKQAFDANPAAGAIGGIIHPDFETSRPDWLTKSLEYPYTIVNLGDRERNYPRKLYPFGANMAIRRGAIGDLRFPENLGRKGSSLLSGEETLFFAQMRKKGWQLLYNPGMRVRHHISAERLSTDWIRKRYYFQGVSIAMEGKGVLGMIRIVIKATIRRIYNAAHSIFAVSPGDRLLTECRRESIRGMFDTLRNKRMELKS